MKETQGFIWRPRNVLNLEDGQGIVESALILVLVAVVAIVILLAIGTHLVSVISNVMHALNT